MIRWTTPTDRILCDTDLSQAKKIYVTYCQHGRVILEKTGDDLVIEDNTILVSFTQADSCRFTDGTVTFDVTILTEDGRRITSVKMTKQIRIPCKDEVIDNG